MSDKAEKKKGIASAFPSMKKPAAEAVAKAREEGVAEFRAYCLDFLLSSCTRDSCRFKHRVPKGFKAFGRKHGFQHGAAARGVEHD